MFVKESENINVVLLFACSGQEPEIFSCTDQLKGSDPKSKIGGNFDFISHNFKPKFVSDPVGQKLLIYLSLC